MTRFSRARVAGALLLALAVPVAGCGPEKVSSPAGEPAPPRSLFAPDAPSFPGDPGGLAYAPVESPYRFRFPGEHAAHPKFRFESWTYAGHLEGGGRRFAYRLAFVRAGLDRRWEASRSAWAPHTLYLGHLLLTEETRGRARSAAKVSRPALGLAGSRSDRLRVWVHDWSASEEPGTGAHRLAASAPEGSLRLALVPSRPPAVHGRAGVLALGEGAAHAYSLARMATRGTLSLGGDAVPVTGTSRLEHEWGSSTALLTGSRRARLRLSLESGVDVALDLLLRPDGSPDPASTGTVVPADGPARALPPGSLAVRVLSRWQSPASGSSYPAAWEVTLPGARAPLRLVPALQRPDEQEVRQAETGAAAWLGTLRVEGREPGARGRGFAEVPGAPTPGGEP